MSAVNSTLPFVYRSWPGRTKELKLCFFNPDVIKLMNKKIKKNNFVLFIFGNYFSGAFNDMKTNKLAALISILFFGIFFMSLSSSAGAAGIAFRKNPKHAVDTSDINKFTRKALIYVSKPQKSQLIKANIDTAEALCLKEGVEIPALLHLARAEYFFINNDYNNSLQEATLAMKLSKNNGEIKVVAMTLNFLGRYNLKTGFIDESIDNFNNAITIAKEKKLKGYTEKNYNDLADVYNTIGNLKQYRSTLQLLINTSNKDRDTLQIENGCFRLGSSLSDKERDFKQADSLLRKCLEISLIRKDTAFTALSLANMGWNYYNEKKYDLAISCYRRSLSYSLPAKRYSNSANSFGNLGTIYRDMGDTEKALINYNKSIQQAKADNDIYNLYWVYQDMSEMYIRKKDTADAYKTYVLFKTYSDAYITKNNSQGLTEAKIRYEANKYNNELELLSLKLSNQRLLIYGYTGLFVLSLAIGILLFSRSRVNAKRRMSEMNRKISEITQANLRQQMNPHFIFNTLNSIQYYMYKHDKLATNDYLTKFSNLMRKILENSQHTCIPLRDELDALKLYLELEMIRFKDRFDYEIKVDEEIDSLQYKVPTMLIQPYVENSISHGLMPCEGKGLVKITLKLKNDCILCTIEDNGIGREAAQMRKKVMEINHNSLGTQIIESRLDLVNAMYGTSLKTIYTDLKNNSGEPEGTRVEIQIPIMT